MSTRETDKWLVPLDSCERILSPEVGRQRWTSKRAVRIVLLGSPNAGKTRLFNCILGGKFEEQRQPTKGLDCDVFYAYLDENRSVVTRVYLQDIPGDERLWGAVPLYTRNMNGGVFVCDPTDKKSFVDLPVWRKMFSDGTAKCSAIVVLTKKDLYNAVDPATNAPLHEQILRQIDMEKVARDSQANCGWRFVSSKTGEGVREAILSLARAADIDPDTEHNIDPRLFDTVNICAPQPPNPPPPGSLAARRPQCCNG